MLNEYSLMMPEKIYSGNNSLEKLKLLVMDKYKKVAVFTDRGIRGSGIVDTLFDILEECKIPIVVFDELPSEPTWMEAQKTVDAFKEESADCIIAIGGGSVMDVAKLASIASSGEYGVKELLEDPLRGVKQVPAILIPTTAGTGSEATPNSIVTVPEKNLKIGIVNPAMIADAVILDGRALIGLPKKIAASTGIDALAHGIECYTSNKANPFSNMFAMEALKLIFNNIIPACERQDAVEEKNNMLLAAFYAGVAITASGTTAVHALSYPLGGRYHIPHGVSNAMMLLPVLKYNKEACLKEFSEIYDAVIKKEQGLSQEEKADLLLIEIDTIIKRLEVPLSLKGYGVSKNDLEALVHDGLEVKRLLVNNKRTVTEEAARMLYLEAMEAEG